MGRGNKSTPELRREAVRLALTSGTTRKEVADDLGIGLSTLTRWVRRLRHTKAPDEVLADLTEEPKLARWQRACGSCRNGRRP